MEEKDFEKKPKKKVGLIITVVVLVLSSTNSCWRVCVFEIL